MRLKGIFILLMLSMTLALSAKKKDKVKEATPVKTLLKSAREAIKNKKDQAKQEKSLGDALKRPELSNEERAEIRYTQAQLNLSLNEAENLKAYLKQSYDTASYFRTILKANQYALQCDSTDTLVNSKGKFKPRFRKQNKEQLLKYRDNLFAGGRFYLRKNDYKTALPYFTMYIDMLKSPLLGQNDLYIKDTLVSKANFYATVAAYNSQQPQVALQYIDKAMESVDDKQKPNMQEYKVRCLLAINDTLQWLNELKKGCNKYPTHDYFFTNLEGYYEDSKQYDEGITLADTMLKNVQNSALYWYAKSLMYLRQEKWEKCIEMCDSTLRLDSVHTDALYNKGLSYINKAMEYAETACYDMRKAKCRKDRQNILDLYKKARPALEQLRKLIPEEKKRWAPALYRIYLNLNMGKEFAEIEKILTN